jgi:hypothetical protein
VREYTSVGEAWKQTFSDTLQTGLTAKNARRITLLPDATGVEHHEHILC